MVKDLKLQKANQTLYPISQFTYRSIKQLAFNKLKTQNTLRGLQEGVNQSASQAAFAQVNIQQKGS
jgi:hypothetical protein